MRWLAVASNIGALHGILLPVNLWRLLEMQRLTRRVRRASVADTHDGLWLQPHMRRRRLATGTVLFRKFDPVDRLDMLVKGQM